MSKFGDTQLVFIEKFVNFCHKNDIWYSADSYTLLHLFSNRHPTVANKQFMVMMTWESYLRLKRLKPHNVVDVNVYKQIKPLDCFYIDNNTEQNLNVGSIIDSQLIKSAIKIRIVVPTTIQLVKKFNNRFFYWLQKMRGYQSNLSNAVNFLYQKPNQGFLWIDERFKKIEHNWASIIDFAIIYVPFAHFTVAIVQNSSELLQSWFELKNHKLITPNLRFQEGVRAS